MYDIYSLPDCSTSLAIYFISTYRLYIIIECLLTAFMIVVKPSYFSNSKRAPITAIMLIVIKMKNLFTHSRKRSTQGLFHVIYITFKSYPANTDSVKPVPNIM